MDGNKVSRVNEIETIAAASDYISALARHKGRYRRYRGGAIFDMMKPTASLLNFSRGELVDHEALRAVMDQGKFEGMYCTDFPNKHVQGHDRCIAIPHLGASTEEAEEILLQLQRIHSEIFGKRNNKEQRQFPDNFVEEAEK